MEDTSIPDLLLQSLHNDVGETNFLCPKLLSIFRLIMCFGKIDLNFINIHYVQNRFMKKKCENGLDLQQLL